MYIFSGILTFNERNKLIKEMEFSPLTNIDENLNEELYKNIIKQSKNPDDPELLKEYKRLSLNKKLYKIREISNASNSYGLDESQSSSLPGGLNRINGSSEMEKSNQSESLKSKYNLFIFQNLY
jgi:hypothetical protein